MSRFAVIELPDYTAEEKKVIFSKFALPKVLKRMSLKEEECVVAPDGLDAVIEQFADTTGIRDLERADPEIRHHEHMLAEGGEGKGKDPSRILPGDLHHGNGKDHGCERIQEASGHIPYNVTFFRIF